jgi:hypothetical protein
MKINDVVAVCHDAKWGRRVKGVVVKTRNGHHIKVAFTTEDGKAIEFWARKRDDSTRYARGAKYYKFGGWVDIDYFSPWFGVYKWEDTKES